MPQSSCSKLAITVRMRRATLHTSGELHLCSASFVNALPQYAFNLFSHNAPMTDNGYNEEEMKMVKETRKILATDDIAVTATCIRVPVMRAHAEAINLELDRELSEDEARDILASAPGVSLSDDRAANRRGSPDATQPGT